MNDETTKLAAKFAENMLRVGTFSSMELLVAAMMLHMRTKKSSGNPLQDDAEMHSLFRGAHDRYLEQRARTLYGPPIKGSVVLDHDLFQHTLGVLLRAHGTLERQMNGTAKDTFEVWQMTSDAYDKLAALQPV